MEVKVALDEKIEVVKNEVVKIKKIVNLLLLLANANINVNTTVVTETKADAGITEHCMILESSSALNNEKACRL